MKLPSMAPNGMMQVWTGLLLRCRDEAQLAAKFTAVQDLVARLQKDGALGQVEGRQFGARHFAEKMHAPGDAELFRHFPQLRLVIRMQPAAGQ